MLRHLLPGVLIACVFIAAPIAGRAAGSEPAAGAAARTAAPRLISWEELMPKGWDPMAEFRGTDLDGLDDTDPRATAMLERLQEIFKDAPTNAEMNDVAVKLPGYIVPLEESQGRISEFLLVPYYGACIHTPPPPANQIVHVKLATPVKFASMDTVWITGRLQTVKTDLSMAVSGYRMQASSVTKYVEGAK